MAPTQGFLWLRGLQWALLLWMATWIIPVSAEGQDGQRETEEDAFYFHIEITDRPFNVTLLDPSSGYYKSLHSEVNDLMSAVYNCSDGCGSTATAYRGTRDVTFGSGYLTSSNMIVVFVFHDSFINRAIVENIFIDKAKNYKVLDINMTLLSAEAVTPPPPTTTSSTKDKILQTSTMSSLSTVAGINTTASYFSPKSSSVIRPITDIEPQNSPTQPFPLSSASTETIDQTSQSTKSGAFTTEHLHLNASTSVALKNLSSSAPITSMHHDKTGSANSSKPAIDHQKGSNKTQTTASPPPPPPYWLDWVPGWGIALLVLASLILLLVIIILILLLIRWCCMEDMGGDDPRRDRDSNHEPYLSHSPAKTPIIKHEMPKTPEKPKGNRTGMYVVNP